MLEKKNVRFDYFILSALILFHLINNAAWLIWDTRPPAWDQSIHLGLGLKYLKLFLHPSNNLFLDFMQVSNYYPPFLHLSFVPIYLIFGVSADWATMGLMIYFSFLIIGVYKLGRYMFCPKVGLLAAFLISMYQFLVYVSRTPLLDLPLTMAVTWGFYFLMRSRNFEDKKYALAFGCISAIGVLIKWTYLFFLFFPVVFIIFKIIKKLNKAVVINFFIAVFSFCIIAGPWYLYNLAQVVQRCAGAAGLGPKEGDPYGLSIESVLYYFWNLEMQIQLLFFILFFLGLAKIMKIWKDYKNKDNLLFLIAWIVVPYIIFTIISNKDHRYTLPFLPAIAIISVFWIPYLNKAIWRKIITYALVITGLLSYVLFTYPILPAFGFSTAIAKLHLSVPYPPLRENWKHKEMFDFIVQTSDVKRNFSVARVLANHESFSSSIFRFYTASSNVPVEPKGYKKPLGEFTDYLMLKTGNLGLSFTTGRYEEPLKEIEKKLPSFTEIFSLSKEFALPDGSMAVIYKREQLPALELKKEFSLNILKEKIKQYFLGSKILDAKDLGIEIIPYNEEESLKGHFKKIIITSKLLNVRDLDINEVKIELENININLYKLWLEDTLVILSLEKIKPELIITKQSIERLIYKKTDLVKDVRIIVENNLPDKHFLSNVLLQITGRIKFMKKYFKISVKGKIKVDSKNEYLYTQVDKIKFGIFRIPKFLYAAATNKKHSLLPAVGWPVRTVINTVKAEEKEALSIK